MGTWEFCNGWLIPIVNLKNVYIKYSYLSEIFDCHKIHKQGTKLVSQFLFVEWFCPSQVNF